MSKIADAEANATSLDGLVNDNGLIATLRNGPKPSWQYIVDQVYAQIGYSVAGSFVTGFTYTGIRQVGVDASGNTWIYTGGQQNIPHVVPAGTVPSSPDYFQVSVNSADNVILDNGENLQQAVDRLNSEADEIPKTKESIEAAYKALGYNNVFFFEDGFTYTEPNDVGIYSDGTAWAYTDENALPVTVAAGTVPSEGVYKALKIYATNVYFNDETSIQDFKDNLSSDQVINTRSGTVSERLTELSSVNYGVFKSPANLGHNIGSFLYAKTGVNSAHMVTDLTGYYPAAYDADLSNYAERGFKAYFVEAGAIGTGDSLADPMGSIGDAIAKPDVDIVFVKKGVYGTRSNFGRATPTRDVSIKSLYGKSTITTVDELGVWTDNVDGTYTLTLPSGNINEVYDLEDNSTKDDLGYLTQLVEVSTIAECQSTAGTWYRGTALAIVHRNVAGAPTNETVYCLRSAPIGFQNFSTNIWFEGFKTFGGQNGGLSILNSTGTFIGYNNEYLYGTGANGDSFNCNGCYLVINEKCTAAAGEKDGFNYHNDENRETHAIEIDCLGIGNRKFGTGNGTTAHEDCRVIRLGGQYSYNNGPGIVDIGTVKCLNVACSSSNNRNDPNSKGFLFTETVEAWCDGGNATNNRTADFETQGDCVMHIRDANYGVYRELSSIPFDSDFS